MNTDPFNRGIQGPFSGSGGGYAVGGGGSSGAWKEGEQDAEMDELLAVLGYKVRASNMAQVAQKLEHLEEVMCSVKQEELSSLASDTVHYNPSDLSSWVDSMISELNPPPDPFMPQPEFSSVTSLPSPASPQIFEDSSFDSDLTAIPGRAAYPQPPRGKTPPAAVDQIQPPSKRFKSASTFSSSSSTSSNTRLSGGGGILGSPSESITPSSHPVESTRPLVLNDPQENGVRLVHTLMACAEAIQKENMLLAEAMVKQIGFLVVSQTGAMRKVATYFAEALARRIYKLYPSNHNDSALSDLLQIHFYEACPYLKFAHFTANQAIFEAFADKNRVHVIDFSLKQGMQWPALLQALAVRPGGPPVFRLTGIGPHSQDNLQEVGWKLARLAEQFNVKFEFRGFVVNSLADLNASMFDVQDGEAVAVNSIFDLHQSLARPGGIDHVLSVLKKIKPEIVAVVEQEANHNSGVFLDRFTESLHYYSTFFDSLEGCSPGEGGDQDKVWSEVYLGRQICNVVACEGILTLGWHTRPLIATSAWKLTS